MKIFFCHILIGLSLILSLNSCKHSHSLTVATEIEEPRNEIIEKLVPLLESSTKEDISVEIVGARNSLIDSLLAGKVDLLITDNNVSFNENIKTIATLYPQILHILHKSDSSPTSIKQLFQDKKIFAGKQESGSYRICKTLFEDFQIDENNIVFLQPHELFDADVIVLFADLLSNQELRDLDNYSFFSLDTSLSVGAGTIADAISMRHPQFSPIILPKLIYNKHTPEPILTLTNESILVCRADLDDHLSYEIARLMSENKQLFYSISPLIQRSFGEVINSSQIMFPLHEGTVNYLQRNRPTFIQRHSNLIGILITILIALMSGLFTYINYRKVRKKDRIDIYYGQLEAIRIEAPLLTTQLQVQNELNKIRQMERETIELIISEQLSANDSYLVFMSMVDIAKSDLMLKSTQLTPSSS